MNYGWEEQSFSYGGYKDLKISPGRRLSDSKCSAGGESPYRCFRHWDMRFQRKHCGQDFCIQPGREDLRFCRKIRVFIIDGAHNRDAAQYLKRIRGTVFPWKEGFSYIMGVFKDKEYEDDHPDQTCRTCQCGCDLQLRHREIRGHCRQKNLLEVWKTYQFQCRC